MTADPEIQTKGESRYCKFSIACDRPKRKGEEKAEVDFFNCIAWNRNADVIVDWFGKCDMVTLVGAVHIRFDIYRLPFFFISQNRKSLDFGK